MKKFDNIGNVRSNLDSTTADGVSKKLRAWSKIRKDNVILALNAKKLRYLFQGNATSEYTRGSCGT